MGNRNTRNIDLLSVKEIFSTKGERYFIPIYQRNYAWRKDEVSQLLEDVADYAGHNERCNYYIGNLIVQASGRDGDVLFETIDGQQRLTTLYIILSALKNQTLIVNDIAEWFNLSGLSFKNRVASDAALRAIGRGKFKKNEKIEPYIKNVYEFIIPELKRVCEDRIMDPVVFLEYFLNWVKILRIEVPQDIDKNHYFEVMNSRGVQLEQHEIVKARMVECLKSKDERYSFGRIWEACSNMERYVQMNFNSRERNILFPVEWRDFDLSKSFHEISKIIVECRNSTNESSKDESPKTLSQMLVDSEINRKQEEIEDYSKGEKTDQFYSVVNFANFLLHVLKVTLPEDDTISLDDKALSDTFSDVMDCMDAEEKTRFVKQFAINLVYCRTLFDRYIVRKRYSDNNDQWSLLCLKSYKDNMTGSLTPSYELSFDNPEEIILLTSMFHVSSPAMIYKNWLCAIISYLFNSQEVNREDYVEFLRELAKSYMLDHYLIRNNNQDSKRLELSEIVNKVLLKQTLTPSHSISDADWSLLNQGVAVENFVFNYYEYLLWKEKKQKYEFIYRTSVEHFFPQHPDEKIRVSLKNPDNLNSFGNLALIRGGDNSRFSNDMPIGKAGSHPDIIETSLKLIRMRNKTNQRAKTLGDKTWMAWLDNEIEEEEKYAIEVFKKALD